jgi:hypothetical protein
MNQQVVAARVDNGTVILLHDQGGECNRFGTTYAVAGVSGDDLVVVSESGGVDLYKIEGGVRAVYSKGLGKTTNPVSIQVGPGLNFSVQKSNGQTDVYAAGQKVRTTGTARVEQSSTPTSSSSSSSSDSEPLYRHSENFDVPEGFIGGIKFKCQEVINDPIPGPWCTIVEWIAGAVALISGYFAFMLSQNCQPLQHGIITVGVPLAVFGTGYWLRHAFAKCLVRSHYGLPAVILALALCSADPTIGITALIAALLVWFWPIWPLLFILVCTVGLILIALGRAAPSMDSKR